MKKILTIGRDVQCDICINDSTDVVSRNHAILEIGKNGKYFIIDQSRNGTYVNGMRISQNEKVPVTRKDVISLAHVRELDWSLVPKSGNPILWVGIAAAVVAVLVCVALLLSSVQFSGSKNGSLNIHGSNVSVGSSGGGTIVGTPNPDDNTEGSDSPAPEEKPETPKAEGKDGKKNPPQDKKPAGKDKKDDGAVFNPIY